MNEIKLPNGGILIGSKGIGGSEASAIIGLCPYMNSVELWEYKTGRRKKKDISNNYLVKYGLQAEEQIRNLYALDFPDVSVNYKPFDLRRHPIHDFMICVLDGEQTRKNGDKGTLEIKTVNVLNNEHIRREWGAIKGNNGQCIKKVPQNYYIQIVHSMFVAQHKFADLVARFRYFDNEGKVAFCKTDYFHWELEDVEEDIKYIVSEEKKYWNNYVLRDVRPPLVLPPI